MLRDSREGRECSQSQIKTIAHGGESQCRLGIRASVTQSPTSYIQSTPRKRSTMSRAIQSHRQLAFKSPWFLVSVAWNAMCWITQPEGSGLQMFKVTSLDSRRTWIPRCRSPCALERTKTTWNDLVLYWGLRSSHAETQESSRREVAQVGRMVLLM